MEQIDRENRQKLAEMSEEEILELQKSLHTSLSPKLQEKIIQNRDSEEVTKQSPSRGPPTSESKSRSGSLQTPPLEAPVSQPPTSTATPPKDAVSDDKSFDEHLRSFFPKATTSVSQPEWTLPVHPAEETFYSTPDSTIPIASTMRFDLRGQFIPATTSRALPTHLGLHHHSLDPGSAGYTLSELAILARSVQPSQKCIALKSIGGVLSDVAGGKYGWDVTEAIWEEIEREKVIEILLSIAKGGQDSGGNRSVQRYASDAVTRWVTVNGPQQWEERLKKKGFERVE
jgi:hypothetical protein